MTADRTPDTVVGWVARMPAPLRPWLRLMRADRPAGFWLLMWPCWWSTLLAQPAEMGEMLRLLALFLTGSIVMRGAGCVWNDILDRRMDAQVARTAHRPLASGQVSVMGALIFMVALSLVGLAVLLSLDRFAILLGLGSLALVAVYPLAKRVTDWPQAVLGLTFNWGALMGWAAVEGWLSPAPLALYAGCLFWTLGYDTIYAHQDAADDAVAGVRSTALRFGARSRVWISGFYILFVTGAAAAGWLAGLAWPWYTGAAAAGLHLGWQVARLDPADPARCLALFRSNGALGWTLFLGGLGAWAAKIA